jgi:Condensation domain
MPRDPHSDDKLAARARLAAALLERGTRLPLTATQEGMWLAEKLSPGHSVYHDTAVLRLTGPLDETALRAAFCDVQNSHHALRCRVIESGGLPMQAFDAGPADWRRTWASAGTRSGTNAGTEEERQVRRLAALDSTEPFDLAAGPLLRARLVTFAEDRNYLVIVFHHLITDGWSHGVFLDALLLAYQSRQRGAAPIIALPRRTYPDWLRDRLRREEAAVRVGPARAAQIAEVPRLPALPGLLPGAPGRRAEAAAVPLTAGQWSAFSRVCAGRGATSYMGVSGIFGQLLCDAGGVGAVLLSAPVADRPDPADAALIGCMINVLPIRIPAGRGAPVDRAVRAGRQATLEALAHADLPYRAIVRELNVSEIPGDPLTELAIEEFNAPVGGRSLGALRIEPVRLGPVLTRHALTLSVVRGSDEPLRFVYPSGRWQAPEVRRIAEEVAGRIVSLLGRHPERSARRAASREEA